MKLQEFLEKFLPEKYGKWNNGIGNGFSTYSEWAFHFFPEALANYTNRICKKQRENCYEAFCSYKDVTQNTVDILNAKQPEMEEI